MARPEYNRRNGLSHAGNLHEAEDKFFPFLEGDIGDFSEECAPPEGKIFIECPGATIYEPETRAIIAGVRFFDEDNPQSGYEIISHPVYAPEHRRKRLIKKENAHSIRRCQACQDLTIRLMRREGPDFYIPNSRFPRKKSLKSVEKCW
jgi:hypothetical protein